MTYFTRRIFIRPKPKSLIFLLLSIVLLNFMLVDAQAATNTNSNIQISIDNENVAYDTNYGYPFIDQNSRTQVPFRITLESFGAVVGYDANLKMAYAKYDNTIVYVPIGQNYIYVNGEKVMNDTKAVIYNSRTYCPIRVILEAFNATVVWDNRTSTVVVSSPTESALLADGFNGDYVTPLVIPTLALIVGYNDVPLSTTEDQWSTFFFGSDKSVSDYYANMSNAHVQIIPAKETAGTTNNGVIRINVNDVHPNYTTENPNYADISTEPIFAKIIKAADQYIDFSQYDSNKDGYLESRELAISIILAGDEESYYRTKTDKAVSGVMVTEAVSTNADAVNLNWYTMSGEMYAQDYGKRYMSTIGVATHEFGHLLGLPDLYDLDSSTVGLAFHSLMASGSNNFNFDYGFGEFPSPLIAWSRAYAGLIEPTSVNTSGTFTLFSNSPYYNILKVPTSDPKIYYLIENRQISDYGIAWNLYMDFGGIAIWKINEYYLKEYMFDNLVESKDDQRGITLIEAAGSNDLLKKNLDIYYTRYNHYFNANYVSQWVSPEGITFNILDPSALSMRVTVTLPQ